MSAITDEMKIYEPFYKSFSEEVIRFLEGVREKHKATVDIYGIGGRIKALSSIEFKIKNSKGKLAKLTDLQDVAGVRVICHCSSDLDRFDGILNEELKKRYSEIERQVHSGAKGYRGVHYVIKKEFAIGKNHEKLCCEIQLRTVLQDAWAIQSHQYGYKKETEADADILKQVVSGILDNCENLWELVKKSVRGGEDVGGDEVSMIYRDTTEKVESANVVSQAETIEKLISINKTVEIDDVLEKEFQNVKKAWEASYSETASPDRAVAALEKIEVAMNPLLLVGILAIKHNKIAILRKVLDKFGPIISLADGKGGYTNLLSVPSASIHNTYYYLGTYALRKLNGGAVHLLLNYKVERDHNGRLYYFRIWESGSVFAPEVIHGADKMFDRLRADYAKNDFAKKLIGVAEEEFVDLACQFNMLFCLKAEQEKEAGKGEPWAYPNFGRFYGYRVSKFLDRIKNREDYQAFIKEAVDEEVTIFGEKFTGRIAGLMRHGLGSGYFWSSLTDWNWPN